MSAVLQTIKEAVRDKDPQAAYRSLKRDLPVDDQPNNVQQVKNVKYNESRRRRGTTAAKRGNAADHIQVIEQFEEEPDSHPFARCVVIMYIDEQLQDIRRFCCCAPIGETTVLGVDKTFNLGQFHVTVTSFKNLSMLRRDTNDHPIFIGPMYIHGSSTTSDYSVFFDHIRSALDNPRSSPTVGSDDEKALRIAIARAWPQAYQIYCHRHLHTNCTEYLSRKVGLTDQQKKPVLAAVFGDTGVTAANSRVVFDARLAHATSLAHNYNFSDYFTNRLSPLLQHNFDTSQQQHFPTNIDTRWTNNNSESANHMLKVAIAWKPKSLLDLVGKLAEVVRGQYEEVERAIINTGDYRLHTTFDRYHTHRHIWRTLPDEQRTRHLKKFYNTCKTVGQTVISSNLATSVRMPAHGGKKKGQTTRKRATRTR